MGRREDLQGVDALDKIREITKHNPTCMFHTRRIIQAFDTRPMRVRKVDENGVFWFFSARDSELNAQIEEEFRAMLTFGDFARLEYLVVSGDARIVDEGTVKKALWTDEARKWFPDGADDPALTLVSVRPTDCRYWDVSDGIMTRYLQIVLGKPDDAGKVQGTLKVK